ncbi:glycerate kinase [Pikeienuella piscinae]|uniref:Glycerate kinase n=1 Tax=Pikeienuella piscinae TaxID=2748098 RepID=A0A7L5BW54_9RHOB|nr:glycerate kinase [Pikeienuella piscinae]QIE55661.1 glycerate kinase [Pikeienuella piscinae]
MENRNEAAFALLRRMFDAAVDVARSADGIRAVLPAPPKGRTLVIGAGKAGATMARAVETMWPGPLSGVVVVPDGYSDETGTIEIVEASHPVPDRRGLAASERILAAVEGLTADDMVLCLISGGGSSLLVAPAAAIGLDDKQRITSDLLRSGATIHEMNCVRKHLSRIKGGRLAVACQPARVVSFIVSDVAGDDLSTIASGPTAPDPSTSGEALAILERYDVAVDGAVRRWLQAAESETPKADHPAFHDVANHLVATPSLALLGAADVAEAAGYPAVVLGDVIESEAREAGRVLAGIACAVRAGTSSLPRRCVLLSGGETTVTVTGKGRGGRNREFILGLALGLAGADGIHALAADTDGKDGAGDIAGAIVGPDTLRRARELGLDPHLALKDNDAGPFFDALGDALHTGPTFTNVNDFRAIIVDPGLAS